MMIFTDDRLYGLYASYGLACKDMDGDCRCIVLLDINAFYT
jgi:hypothetical protein